MTQADAALVSILVRSMDRPTLVRALDSAAAQSWPNLEIVVVAACGAGHGALPETWKGRPLRLVQDASGRRLARADAANLALESAHGEWLNFLDDDDELLPAHLATLLGASRREQRVLYAQARVVDTAGRMLGHAGHAGNHVQLYFHSRSTPCATLVHRSLVEAGARFDPAFDVHEDHDFQVNLATRTAFRYVEAVTCVWHAQIGESGCGFGPNDDAAQRHACVMRIREKWSTAFSRWLGHADAVLRAGQQYLKGGDLPAAVACFEQVLHLRPDDVNALNLGGVAHWRGGNLERAEQWLAQAARQLPRHPGIQENLRLVRAASGSTRGVTPS